MSYRIVERVCEVDAGCDCCTDYEYYYDIVGAESGVDIDTGFTCREDALLAILSLHDIKVEVE